MTAGHRSGAARVGRGQRTGARATRLKVNPRFKRKKITKTLPRVVTARTVPQRPVERAVLPRAARRAELTILRDRFWSGPPGRGGPAGGVVLTLWIAPLRGVRETTVVADPLGGSIPPRRAQLAALDGW